MTNGASSESGAGGRSNSGLPDHDYFAPDFEVSIDGSPVLPARRGDVVSIKVTLGIQELGSCELVVNDWDEERRDFRKTGDRHNYDVGRRVKVKLGYAGQLTTVFMGQISRIAPRYPDNAPPSTTVTALDGLMRLRNRHTRASEARRYENKTDSQIVELVAQRHNLRTRIDASSEVHPEVWQATDQDDASFLLERARRIDYDCYLLHDDASGADTLHFVRPTDGRSGGGQVQLFRFTYQQNVSSFTPSIDIHDQVASVTVRGWDSARKEPVSYTARASDLPESGRGRSGPDVARQDLGERETQIVDALVSTVDEARARAIAVLRDRAYRHVTADLGIIGLPDVRLGHNVQIDQVGSMFGGRYYVKGVEHTLNEQGFKTLLKLRKLMTEPAS